MTKNHPSNPQNPANWSEPFETLREAEDYMHSRASGDVGRAECCLS